MPKMKYLDPIKLCREVVKLTPSGPLLSLSVNTKHVGLAIYDVTKKVASPFRTLAWNRKDPHLIASDLQSLISRHSISGLVVGHPFGPRKRCRPKGELLVDDIIEIGKLQDVYYTFWDETGTTKWVQQLLKHSPKKYGPIYSCLMQNEYAAFENLEDFMCLFDPYHQRTFQTFQAYYKDRTGKYIEQ